MSFEDAVANRREEFEAVAESDLDAAWIAATLLNAAEKH